jgi:hypothetical protein
VSKPIAKIKAIVSRQEHADTKAQPEKFHNENSKYAPEPDAYGCPRGQTLYPHSKKTASGAVSSIKPRAALVRIALSALAVSNRTES